MRADKFTDSNLNSKKICHDDNRWFDSSPPYHRDTHSKITGFTYAQLEKHIVDGSCGDREIDKKICNLHYKNLHKITPMPYFKKQLPLEGF